MLLSCVERAYEAADVARVLVACSGGVDSVVLAHASVHILGAPSVVLGHVDHAVRADSAVDAEHVEGFADTLGAGFGLGKLLEGRRDEARLREGRYLALEQLRANARATHIATAHTRDDQAESVLIGLVRSTRVVALGGIPRTRGPILRPLLDVSRAEVERYAHRHRLSWREDSTNREPRYLRNRVRKELLPLLESRYRLGITERLAALAGEVAGHPPLRAPTENRREPPRVSLPVTRGISLEMCPWRGGAIPDGRHRAVFDAAHLERPIVRAVRPGDRIRPFGMSGRRKVQDVLVDAKVPKNDREGLLILVDDAGDVIWIPGIVRSSFAPVGVETINVWVCAEACGDAPIRSV